MTQWVGNAIFERSKSDVEHIQAHNTDMKVIREDWRVSHFDM